MNSQPMGFYPMETIKEDARRFGVPFLNPCVNRSDVKCTPEKDSVLLGLGIVRDVGVESAKLIVQERERHGPYSSAGDLVRRTGLKPQTVHSLVMAGAFDSITTNRRRPCGMQASPSDPRETAKEQCLCLQLPAFHTSLTSPIKKKMAGEYSVIGSYPRVTSWTSSGPPSLQMSYAPPTSTPCPRRTSSCSRAGPWPGSTLGAWKERYS